MKIQMLIMLGAVLSLAAALAARAADATTQPAQASERDPRMQWWRQARFGMFIHWGLYSIPGGEWNGQRSPKKNGEWIMNDLHVPVADYEKLAQQFNPTKFNAKEFARIANDAGMKYVVITSKHHDGFCLWDSKVTDYDIMSTPFKRDILKELSEAVRAQGMKMCFYHSIMDWHHPDAQAPNFPKYSRREGEAKNPNFDRYVQEYLKPQLRELLTNYGPIGVLWFDGEWIPEWNDDYGRDIYKFCRSIQPDIIVNNRVGKTRKGLIGVSDAESPGDFFTPEQQIPKKPLAGNWESCITMNDTWGFRKDDDHWKSTPTIVRMLIETSAKGGNLLLNVGPTPEGEIPQPSVERLADVGKWMETNGEAIYGTEAGPIQTSFARSTMKDDKIYVHVLEWPDTTTMKLPLKDKVTKAYLLAARDKALEARSDADGVTLTIPSAAADSIASVIVLEK